MGENLIQISLCGIACRIKIHEGVVAAVAGGGARYLTPVSGYECECLAHERQYVGRSGFARYYKIVAGAASHGTPVYYAVFPLRMVAQEGGGEVFHGVEGTWRDGFLTVGLGETDVECGDYVAGWGAVGARNIDAAQKSQVVDGETCYLFHFACSG